MLFAYVFGGAIGARLDGVIHGSYINYLAPGIIIMAVDSGCATTAIKLCIVLALAGYLWSRAGYNIAR